MGDQINKHNLNILRSKPKELKCNCRDQAECPLPGNGKCRTDKVIYRATVEANNQVETYVGLTAGELKTRYQQHKSDFNNTSDKNATTMSTHIWNLKDHNTPYDIKFEIVGRAAPYSAVTGRCNLCTSEKYEILFNPEKATLNSRNELFSACRHKWTTLLVKKKRKTRTRGRWPPTCRSVNCNPMYWWYVELCLFFSCYLFSDEWSQVFWLYETLSKNKWIQLKHFFS